MKIFIADLNAHNQGHRVGEWIDLPSGDIDDIIEEVLDRGAELCGDDEHKEVFIAEFENEFDCLKINPNDDLDKLNEIVEKLESLDKDDWKKVNFLLENFYESLDFALENYEEVCIYEKTSMEEIAYEYLNGCFNINDYPDIIRRYIDYKSMGEDMLMDGYYEVDRDIYEYRNY